MDRPSNLAPSYKTTYQMETQNNILNLHLFLNKNLCLKKTWFQRNFLSSKQLISYVNPTIYKYDCYNIFLPCYETDQKLNQLQPTTTTTLITDTTTIQLQLQIKQLQPQMQTLKLIQRMYTRLTWRHHTQYTMNFFQVWIHNEL